MSVILRKKFEKAEIELTIMAEEVDCGSNTQGCHRSPQVQWQKNDFAQWSTVPDEAVVGATWWTGCTGSE